MTSNEISVTQTWTRLSKLLHKNFELDSQNKFELDPQNKYCFQVSWGDVGDGQIGKNRSAGEFLSSDALNRETVNRMSFKYCQYYNLQCQITKPASFHRRLMIIHSWPYIVHRTLVGMHPVLCEYTMRWICLPITEFQKDAEAGQVIGQHWPFQITASLLLPLSCGGNEDSRQTVRS